MMQKGDIEELKWISSDQQMADFLKKKGCFSRNTLLLPQSNQLLKKRDENVDTYCNKVQFRQIDILYPSRKC